MMLLTIDEILMLHNKLIATTGGSPGLRDRGLLESTVYRVDSSFEDVECYPSIEEMWMATSASVCLLCLQRFA